MSNKAFFNSFFNKNNKIFRQIQNNPLAHRDLMPNWYNEKVYMRLLRANGTPYPRGVHIDELVNFYPGAALPARVRINQGFKKLNDNNPFGQNFATLEKHKQHWKNYAQAPAMGAILPNPLAGGLTPAQIRTRSIQNITHMLWADRFEAYKRKKYDRNANAEHFHKKDDYWLPHYEGDFMNLAEKGVKKQPFVYDRHMKFLGNKSFFSPKQKEAMVWLHADFTPSPPIPPFAI